jgi:hypothetical protein
VTDYLLAIIYCDRKGRERQVDVGKREEREERAGVGSGRVGWVETKLT